MGARFQPNSDYLGVSRYREAGGTPHEAIEPYGQAASYSSFSR